MVTSANGGVGLSASATVTVGEQMDCDNKDLEVSAPGTVSTPCSFLNHGATDTMFSASRLPPGTQASFTLLSQSPIVTKVNMIITTSLGTSSAHSPGIGTMLPFYAALFPILGLVGLGLGKRKSRTRLRLAMMLAGLALLLAFVGCGGGSFQNATPAGTFPITVTATSASTGQSASTVVNLTVISQGPQH